ncbi:Fatty acid-binding -like protein 1 [Echinococcus granulosus]|nr:Fatty acid-binding -like protein 1 [Echinococcus granulosus]
MEAFLGTWKVDSNGDFHKFMHHFGVPTAIAKMVLLVGSKTIFSQKDADTYCIAVSSIKGKTEAAFRLDQEFEEACSGGATMKSKITMEGGVMKHIQVGGGETIITTRTINGNIMTVVYTVGDLTCSRTYKRVQ